MKLAATSSGLPSLHQVSQEHWIPASMNSNRSKQKKGTNPKKRRPKSDKKVRFIFGKDMSVDEMIDALKEMTGDMGMEFVPEKEMRRAKPRKKAKVEVKECEYGTCSNLL